MIIQLFSPLSNCFVSFHRSQKDRRVPTSLFSTLTPESLEQIKLVKNKIPFEFSFRKPIQTLAFWFKKFIKKIDSASLKNFVGLL